MSETADRPEQREVCPDCGYHDGQHGENCHIHEWTEAEKRAADGDR